MYYVYILHSKKDSKLYIGYAVDLKRRLKEHQDKKVKSTAYRQPFELLCYEAYHHKMEAVAREKFLKSGDGRADLHKRLSISLKQIKGRVA